MVGSSHIICHIIVALKRFDPEYNHSHHPTINCSIQNLWQFIVGMTKFYVLSSVESLFVLHSKLLRLCLNSFVISWGKIATLCHRGCCRKASLNPPLVVLPCPSSLFLVCRRLPATVRFWQPQAPSWPHILVSDWGRHIHVVQVGVGGLLEEGCWGGRFTTGRSASAFQPTAPGCEADKQDEDEEESNPHQILHLKLHKMVQILLGQECLYDFVCLRRWQNWKPKNVSTKQTKLKTLACHHQFGLSCVLVYTLSSCDVIGTTLFISSEFYVLMWNQEFFCKQGISLLGQQQCLFDQNSLMTFCRIFL